MEVFARNTTQYVIPGTKTYRLGSRALWKRPPFNGYGTNLQNIEKSMRRLYVADEGMSLVQTDQSGADALIVSRLMNPNNKLKLLFDNGIKIHVYLGVAFWENWVNTHPYVIDFMRIPIPELHKHPHWETFVTAVKDSDNNPPESRYYYLYKQAGHSGNYGIRAQTFVDNILLNSGGAVRLTRSQGDKLLEGYHGLIPELRSEFHRYVAKQYEDKGILYNLQGFPITITQKVFDNDYSKIYDKIPQSTVAGITNIAYTDLQNYIEQLELAWDMLGNTHDSYVSQAPDSEVMDCARKQKEFMESQELISPVTGERFRMGSETSIGKNWAPYHKDKNPEGMKVVKL
jgi:hypothetical protein